MDELIALIRTLFAILLSIGFLSLPVRAIALWASARLRVTDGWWTGSFAVLLIAAPIRLWDDFHVWGILPVAIGVALGLVWARRDLKALRERTEDEERPVLGFFFTGRDRIPESVRNWFG